MKELFSKLCCLFLALLFAGAVQAQSNATLSFQGILKKSNGVAVEDGTYSITFNLYDTEQGGTALWSETQPEVEVTSGIYSVLLGETKKLNVAFDKIYYLGVKVGSAEMAPRFKLTSAPYALSLIGQTNLFPSTGTVKADSLQVEGKITAAGIRARGGAPGLNGLNNNGYAFEGNGGDNDSGLFSTEDGSVSLYANNIERLKVSGNGAKVNGDLSLDQNGAVVYNGLKDWRLFDIDNFKDDAEDWNAYTNYFSNTTSGFGRNRIEYGPAFGTEWVIYKTDAGASNILRKTLNLSGVQHEYVKVVFDFYFFGTVDSGEEGFGGFSGGTNVFVPKWVREKNNSFYNIPLLAHDSTPSGNDDAVGRYEMVIRDNSDSISIIFGSTMGSGITDEAFAVGNIEIWVR